MKNGSQELIHDLSELLKEEGSYVKDMTELATKAAGFHARLESIEKALGKDSMEYSSKETDKLAKMAEDKYSSELEGAMKNNAMEHLKTK